MVRVKCEQSGGFVCRLACSLLWTVNGLDTGAQALKPGSVPDRWGFSAQELQNRFGNRVGLGQYGRTGGGKNPVLGQVGRFSGIVHVTDA